MAIGAIIGGVLGAGSSIGATAWQADTARKTAHEQIDFQREMSNTAYQRAVTDMQRAGLNPMLAYSQGGASTPSGAQMQVPQAPNIAASAVAGSQAGAQLSNIEADTRMKEAQSRNSNASAQATQIQTIDMAKELQEEIRNKANSSGSKAWQDRIDAFTRNLEFEGRGSDDPDYGKPFSEGSTPYPNMFDRVRQAYAKSTAEKNYAQSRATGESLGLSEKRADEEFWRDNNYGKYMKELGPTASSALQILMRMMRK